METNNISTQNTPDSVSSTAIADQKKQKTRVVLLVGGSILFLGLFVAGIVFLSLNPGPTVQIRDIFIILMALVSIVIGLALIILIIQLSVLINLLQCEVKPILNSTNETVSTLRGTVSFLSNNLVEPIIKLNEYLAGIKRLLDLMRFK
jgi:hypothetical protein